MRKMVLLGLAAALALSGCSATPKSEAKSPTFDTTGSVSVPSGAWDSRYAGQPCDGFRGISDRPIDGNYDDIGPGTQVVVKNESGKTISVTMLDAGTITEPGTGTTLVCTSSFTLTGLPDSKFYSIHVGGPMRSDVQFTKSEMKAGPAMSAG